jgi:hypothetical protein
VSDLGDLSAAPDAALIGMRGLRAVIDDNAGIYVTDDVPAAERRVAVSFAFDPNSIKMVDGDRHVIFSDTPDPRWPSSGLYLRFRGGAYQSWRRPLEPTTPPSRRAIGFGSRAAPDGRRRKAGGDRSRGERRTGRAVDRRRW